eukprot:scaffold168307_cov46-Prasinocladus_malaysianus.AAC.1
MMSTNDIERQRCNDIGEAVTNRQQREIAVPRYNKVARKHHQVPRLAMPALSLARHWMTSLLPQQQPIARGPLLPPPDDQRVQFFSDHRSASCKQRYTEHAGE